MARALCSSSSQQSADCVECVISTSAPIPHCCRSRIGLRRSGIRLLVKAAVQYQTHSNIVCLYTILPPPPLSKLQLPQTQRGLGRAECLRLPGLPSYMQECAAAVCGAEWWQCVSLGSARLGICVSSSINPSLILPPDEANENEGPGQLNNQLSWKQGRQLLRQ